MIFNVFLIAWWTKKNTKTFLHRNYMSNNKCQVFSPSSIKWGTLCYIITIKTITNNKQGNVGQCTFLAHPTQHHINTNSQKSRCRDSCTCNFIRIKVTTVNISFVIGVLETRNIGSFKLNRLNRYVFSNIQKKLQLGWIDYNCVFNAKMGTIVIGQNMGLLKCYYKWHYVRKTDFFAYWSK